MAYGIQLLNENGIPAIDMERQTLRVYDTGTTVEQFPLYQTVWPAGYAGATPGVDALWRMVGAFHSPSQGVELIDAGSGRFALVPESLGAGGGGFSAFYRIGTAVNFSVEAELDLDPGIISARTWCLVDGARPYRLTAPIAPVAIYPNGHGMQIFNAAGAKVFDSRDEYLAVRYAFIVPKAVVDDVLTNGTTKTITLPESMPNAWFSIPFLCCREVRFIRFTIFGEPVYKEFKVLMRQTSATQVQLTRWDSGELLYYVGYSRPEPYYSHDIVVYVARNP